MDDWAVLYQVDEQRRRTLVPCSPLPSNLTNVTAALSLQRYVLTFTLFSFLSSSIEKATTSPALGLSASLPTTVPRSRNPATWPDGSRMYPRSPPTQSLAKEASSAWLDLNPADSGLTLTRTLDSDWFWTASRTGLASFLLDYVQHLGLWTGLYLGSFFLDLCMNCLYKTELVLLVSYQPLKKTFWQSKQTTSSKPLTRCTKSAPWKGSISPAPSNIWPKNWESCYKSSNDTVPSITSVEAPDKSQKNSMQYYWPEHKSKHGGSNLKQNFYFQVVGNFMLGKFRQILNLYLKVYDILIDRKHKICSENKSCFLKRMGWLEIAHLYLCYKGNHMAL